MPRSLAMLAACAIMLAVVPTGCKSSKDFDKGMKNIGKGLEKAGKNAGKALNKAGRKLQDATE